MTANHGLPTHLKGCAGWKLTWPHYLPSLRREDQVVTIGRPKLLLDHLRTLIAIEVIPLLLQTHYNCPTTSSGRQMPSSSGKSSRLLPPRFHQGSRHHAGSPRRLTSRPGLRYSPVRVRCGGVGLRPAVHRACSRRCRANKHPRL